LFEFLSTHVSVVRRVVVNNLRGIEMIDFVNVVPEFSAQLGFILLYFLKGPTLNKAPTGLKVMRQDLGKLMDHVLEDVCRGLLSTIRL
jgi:hypothetical protein